MMGRQASGQDRLFYSFNLEDHVPQNHLLRGIDRCLDFGGLREHLAEHYSQIGHLKRILRLDRLRLRGLCGASDEFTMAAVVQNLRRLAVLVPQGPPTQGIGAPA